MASHGGIRIEIEIRITYFSTNTQVTTTYLLLPTVVSAEQLNNHVRIMTRLLCHRSERIQRHPSIQPPIYYDIYCQMKPFPDLSTLSRSKSNKPPKVRQLHVKGTGRVFCWILSMYIPTYKMSRSRKRRKWLKWII